MRLCLTILLALPLVSCAISPVRTLNNDVCGPDSTQREAIKSLEDQLALAVVILETKIPGPSAARAALKHQAHGVTVVPPVRLLFSWFTIGSSLRGCCLL